MFGTWLRICVYICVYLCLYVCVFMFAQFKNKIAFHLDTFDYG